MPYVGLYRFASQPGAAHHMPASYMFQLPGGTVYVSFIPVCALPDKPRQQSFAGPGMKAFSGSTVFWHSLPARSRSLAQPGHPKEAFDFVD
ncbi:MAG: hypothetical protein CMN76_07715 [Spirochaetaceae bacterium]|nr:hypothetical protein [Spirochaetaceae bacterium]